MKIRYLTLLATLVFLGFSVTTMAHPCKHHTTDPTHEHCSQEPGDDPSPWYDVTITGPDGGGDGYDEWGVGEYWKASNNRQVNYKHFDPVPSTGLLDLTFFRNYFKENGNGLACFPSGDVQIHSVILNYKKSTGARALIWFHGNTYQDTVPVLYQLSLNGEHDKDNWPPAEDTSNRMVMAKWNMGLANEGSDIQAISCLKEDTVFTGKQVDIFVESIPIPIPEQ